MTIVGLVGVIANREPWMEHATCGSSDPEAFFVEKGGSPLPAKRVCRLCPVQEECLKYAMEHNENWGIWGGLTAFERRNIRRSVTKPSIAASCGTPAGATRHYKRHESLCQECRAAYRNDQALRRANNGGAA